MTATAADFLQPGFAPYYDCYATSDQPVERFVAVGSVEPQFFAVLLTALNDVNPIASHSAFHDSEQTMGRSLRSLASAIRGLKEGSTAPAALKDLAVAQTDRSLWPALRRYVDETFRSESLAFWIEKFSPNGPFRDACVTPVLSQEEATTLLKGSRVPAVGEGLGLAPPQPNPWISLGNPAFPLVPAVGNGAAIVKPGSHSVHVLRTLGWEPAVIDGLLRDKVVIQT